MKMFKVLFAVSLLGIALGGCSIFQPNGWDAQACKGRCDMVQQIPRQ